VGVILPWRRAIDGEADSRAIWLPGHFGSAGAFQMLKTAFVTTVAGVFLRPEHGARTHGWARLDWLLLLPSPQQRNIQSSVLHATERTMRTFFALLVVCLSVVMTAYTQDAVPGEMLKRTIMISNSRKYGTAFKIDDQGRVYLVTARHMVEGMPTTKATFQVWEENWWQDLPTTRTLLPKSNDVDIAVLETDEKIDQPYGITADDTGGGVTFGQQVWFLGYPFQIMTHGPNGETFPFMKRGSLSAIDSRNPNAVLIFIDGFNNEGFSGGPVIYWDFKNHKYSLLAVVKGYLDENARIRINGEDVKTQYLVNSGILIGFSTKHIKEAIESGNKQP
jgi:Trypsin-like peptidase domain